MRAVEKARVFLYLSLGIAALTAALQFVVPDAASQTTQGDIAFVTGTSYACLVVLSNGDMYDVSRFAVGDPLQAQYIGNAYAVIGVSPVSTDANSLGSVKRQYR